MSTSCSCGIGTVLRLFIRMLQWRSIAATGCIIVGLGIATLLPVQASSARRYLADPEGSYYTEALNILYSNGWHDVSNLERTGDVVHAVAVHQTGQPTPVTVDLKARTVLPA
ncbi:MAG: hypothetical protein QOD93_902 [Acetobacteraceae bacterium]|jgi:hypothetical protein|nr:hypothetical protein [Rhodopila sp.]MEA2767940.1 hypothetical protein [Acetobacteraceae bacterium]